MGDFKLQAIVEGKFFAYFDFAGINIAHSLIDFSLIELIFLLLLNLLHILIPQLCNPLKLC